MSGMVSSEGSGNVLSIIDGFNQIMGESGQMVKVAVHFRECLHQTCDIVWRAGIVLFLLEPVKVYHNNTFTYVPMSYLLFDAT